eukprot:1401409-Heterocapsa_arctica.AAC.1
MECQPGNRQFQRAPGPASRVGPGRGQAWGSRAPREHMQELGGLLRGAGRRWQRKALQVEPRRLEGLCATQVRPRLERYRRAAGGQPPPVLAARQAGVEKVGWQMWDPAGQGGEPGHSNGVEHNFK